ncbi:hypothetical protein, partial [Nocardia sp. 2TAF39]|uniref:hypothetical protein n=1 Tax=Nocardia sp. 2TAF39 TaxID=3233017 RepID=UPI003F964C2A
PIFTHTPNTVVHQHWGTTAPQAVGELPGLPQRSLPFLEPLLETLHERGRRRRAHLFASAALLIGPILFAALRPFCILA